MDPHLFFSEKGVYQLSPFPEPSPRFLGALLTPPPPEVKTRHAQHACKPSIFSHFKFKISPPPPPLVSFPTIGKTVPHHPPGTVLVQTELATFNTQ